MNKKAVTLLEVLIAVLILAITMANLVNLFVSGKRYILHARSRMTAAELSRSFLASLQMDVRQDSWGSNCVSADGVDTNCDTTPQTIDNIDYVPSYTKDLVAGTGLRRVVTSITWTENLP